MGRTMSLSVQTIRGSRWQPRSRAFDPKTNAKDKELVESVKRHGILTRLLVWRSPVGDWELIAGSRRLAAAKVADLQDVPVEHVEGKSEQEIRQMVLIENLLREDLTPIEEAQAYRDLLEAGEVTQAELSYQLGISQGKISQRLGLLRMDSDVQKMLAEGDLDATDGRALATLDPELQRGVAEHVVEAKAKGEITTRKVQTLAKRIKEASDPAFWALPEGMRATQEQVNTARFAQELVAEAREGGALAQGLICLREQGLLKNPWKLHSSELMSFASCFGKTGWEHVADSQGWICDHCQLKDKGLGGAPGVRCKTKSGRTCLGFIPEGEPFLLIPMWRMQEHGCDECEKARVEADDLLLCPDADCYLSLMQAAEQQTETDRRDEKTERREKWVAEFQQWMQLQHSLQTGHWLAQACQDCVYLSGGQCAKLNTGYLWSAPWTFYLAERQSMKVPLCSRHRRQTLDGVREGVCNRETVLLWIKAFETLRKSYGGGSAFDFLGFPHENAAPAKLLVWLEVQGITVGQSYALLTMAANWIVNDRRIGYHTRAEEAEPVTLCNPVDGELEEWVMYSPPFYFEEDATLPVEETDG